MPTVAPLQAFGPPRKIRHPFEGKTDTRRRRKLKDVARTLPRVPGVYFFYGWDDRLLYIGKAKCLRERVRSYFAETSSRRPPKLRRLLAEIKRLEYRECGSELEALLLERRLIAELLPILNRQHKRFEIYPYLLLTDEEFPRLTVTRAEPVQGEEGEVEEEGARRGAPIAFVAPQSASLPLETPPHAGSIPGMYLGPFTSPRSAAWTFEAVRTLFPLRSCEGALKVDANGRSCFYHDIGRCAGPCVGAASRDSYAAICADLLQLLKTGDAPQIDAMRERMLRYAEEWKFEEAAQIKEQLTAIEAVASRLRRLQRMREQNNVVIVQPAVCPEGESDWVALFMVQAGLVRRHIIVRDWSTETNTVRDALRAVYDAPPPAADFTAKTELDEMMILDRWLKVHGSEEFCLWQNERKNRQWTSNTVRGINHCRERQTRAAA